MGSTFGKDQTITRLYKKGYSVGLIARNLGVATTAISQKLERLGLRERINQLIVPDKKRAQVARWYRRGIPTSTISKTFGISKWTVRSIARERGCKINPKGQQYRSFTKQQVSAIAKLWESGQSQYYIGQQFGVSQVIIGRVLRDAGFRKETRHARGERHGSWKGGATTVAGYRTVMLPIDHRFRAMSHRGGYVMEHRLRMAEHLGRPLTDREIVHHINGNRLDNRVENLELRRRVDHQPGVRMKCATCGSCNVVPY